LPWRIVGAGGGGLFIMHQYIRKRGRRYPGDGQGAYPAACQLTIAHHRSPPLTTTHHRISRRCMHLRVSSPAVCTMHGECMHAPHAQCTMCARTSMHAPSMHYACTNHHACTMHALCMHNAEPRSPKRFRLIHSSLSIEACCQLQLACAYAPGGRSVY